MKQRTQLLVSIAFPWLLFLINDKPIAALAALLMQASVIAWIPASIWAWNNRKRSVVTPQPKTTTTLEK